MTVRRQEIVDGDAEGVLRLDHVEFGADRVLGAPGAGVEVLDWLVARCTVGLCALRLGVSEVAPQMTATYASGRVQFDRPIATFRAVGERLANCYIDIEAIRLTMWQAAWRLSEKSLPAPRSPRRGLGGGRRGPGRACRGAYSWWLGY